MNLRSGGEPGRAPARIIFIAALSAVLLMVLVGPASAELCLFPGVPESCSGAGCVTDFGRDGDDQAGEDSAFDLGQRRARASAEGALGNQRETSAEIGVRLTPQQSQTVEISVLAVLNGVIEGCHQVPNNFGDVRVRAMLRDLTSDTIVDEAELFQQTESGDPGHCIVTLVPQNPFNPPGPAVVSGPLEAGREYAVSLRVDTKAKGVFAHSDFFSGNRGVRLEALEISSTGTAADSDGDGLFDAWETAGITDCSGALVFDLPALGATPDHKDIFVEYDWLPGRLPRQSAIRAVKEAFAAAPVGTGGTDNPDGQPGIRVWIDTGSLVESPFNGAVEDGAIFGSCIDGIDNGGDGKIDGEDPDCLVGDNLGGGNQIPLADLPSGTNVPKLTGDADGDGTADFYEVKAKHFAAARRLVFHYAISGIPRSNEDGAGSGSCTDGIDNGGDGLTDGDDVLDCFAGGQGEKGGNDFIVFREDPGAFMHELGHNLNLDHGGPAQVGGIPATGSTINCKPNYLSVMNYSLDTGISQDTNPGQDLDGDGAADFLIIDFSPPRLPGGRAKAPLATLDEDALDETAILDATDGQSQLVFITPSGGVRTAAVNQPVNWDNVGGATQTSVAVNVNAGPAADCTGSPAGETLIGGDDWSNIVLRFAQFGDANDGPRNVVQDPEPDEDEARRIRQAINTTDLGLQKTVTPVPVAAGQPVSIRLVATNHGPNHTGDVEVVDFLPAGVEVTGLPAICSEVPAGTVRCALGRLRRGESRDVTIAARIDADLDCGDEQFRTLRNLATVINRAGSDPVAQNNRAEADVRALCLRYEYSAKIVCGRQNDPDSLRLLRGLYGTAVNIHNPNDERVFFFKKLALSYPPAEQKPGKIYPIGIDGLDYDESLKADCDDLKRRLFEGKLPGGVIEGFLVVQGPRSLDVEGVYTAAPLARTGEGVGVSSLHLERVRERDRRAGRKPLPDLVIDPDVSSDLVCTGSHCRLHLVYRVRNAGKADAAAFGVRIVAGEEQTPLADQTLPEGLKAGAVKEMSLQAEYEKRPGADVGLRLCIRADAPAGAVTESDEANNERCVGST